ncbi:ArsR family transcriptional regulator [Saccharomonospora amisosensis]|uniref:ArsR family transcriptional regulator n=1 Tax=Saccharomonospora amisosensis TaxID=1128677 RepID=A0A7X5UQN7_9PSEU|nr:metalloregulator ArsR/SmtB family transcription factor [Saccharomonospora amisosensis]NIJ12453.1 ArsR family transcriptional regulator [Saccharomonospora amisosensis]
MGNTADGQAAGLDPALRAELHELTAILCKALNDPKRLMLLYALAGGPRSVGELCELLDTTQPNVSQHLAMLRERGIVGTRRSGNSIFYSLRYPQLLHAIDLLRDIMAAEAGRRRDLAGRA